MWKVGIAVAAICVSLGMTAVLGAAGVQRRVFDVPYTEYAAGPFRVVAFVTKAPSCSNLRGRGTLSLCIDNSIYAESEYFVIWAKYRSWRGPAAVERAQRLVLLRLADRAPVRR